MLRYRICIRITDGSLSVDRHEIDVRPFETLRFDLKTDAEIDSIAERTSHVDLSGKAVLGLLLGEKNDQSVTRKAVQRYLAERSYCARVYDDRQSVITREEAETERGNSESV